MEPELARRLGSHVLVDYSQAEWSRRVLEATGGRGADLILESVGGRIAAECLRCWAPGGRMVIYGQASGEPAQVTGDDLLFENRAAYGLAVGQVIENETLMRQAMQQLADRIDRGELRLVIGRTYPLKEAAQAHRDLESRWTQGKLVLLP